MWRKTTLVALWAFFGAMIASATEPLTPNEEKIAKVASGELVEALASWWGYDPLDATDSLQKALDSGVKKLTIDQMTSDWVVRPLRLPSDIEIVLADNVTVRAKPGEFLGVSDSLFTAALKENVTIRGGKNSTFAMRKADYHAEPYRKAEWRHGLNIKSSKNVRIENLTIRDTGGDGIYLGVAKAGVPCENIVIKNVVCDANNRQGISVISAKNLLIEGCDLSNTAGTAPAAGIDFEPNRADKVLVDCVLRDCRLENNAGCGIALYLPNLNAASEPASLVFENCVTRGNQSGFFLCVGNGDEASLRGSIQVRACRFERDRGGIQIDGKAVGGLKLAFDDVTIAEMAGETSRSFIRLGNRSSDQYALGGIEFQKVTLIGPLDREPISYVDSTPFGYGPSELTGSLTRKKSADDSGETVALNQAWIDAKFPKLNRRNIPRVVPDLARLIPLDPNVSPEEKKSSLRLRNKGQWLLYAKEGERILSLQAVQVGKSEIPTVTPLLVSPSGKERKLASLGKNFTADYDIEATETGVWRLAAEAGTHSLVLKNANVPNTISFTPAVNLIGTTGTFYFYVPEGTSAFAARVTADEAERVTATIIDPAGKQVWREENIDRAKLFDSPSDFSPGVWTIRFERPTVGVLEDFSFTLYGVIPSLTNERRFLLTERKN